MDMPIITMLPPARVRGGWALDVRVCFGGWCEPVRITITEALAAKIAKAAGARISGEIDDLLEIAGIWDKISATGKAIVSNPAVRMAVSMVPYGSTALTVADAGFAVADAASSSVKAQQKVKAQHPRLQKSIAQHAAALKLARDLRANKPAAKRAIIRLPPASAALVQQARLYDARTDAIKDFRLAKDGNQGALARIQRVKAMATRNPFALAYTEALENAAIADQAPPAESYARSDEVPDFDGSDASAEREAASAEGEAEEAEVGARVKRPKRRRPVAHIIAELNDVVRPRAAA
jgi:hypothetical protein